MFWGTPHHKLFCSQITCLKALSLNLVVAFMPENEALLPVFFIIFATVMAHIFTIYCSKQFTVVFPNLPSPGTFFRQQSVLVSIPQQESFVMHKAYFRMLVSRILVWRPPDLPDHFLRPCNWYMASHLLQHDNYMKLQSGFI